MAEAPSKRHVFGCTYKGSAERTTERKKILMALFRKVFVVAVTGAASAAAFTVPPAALPHTGGNAAPLRAASGAAPRSLRSASLSLEMARVPFIAGNWKMNPTSVTEVTHLLPLYSSYYFTSFPFEKSFQTADGCRASAVSWSGLLWREMRLQTVEEVWCCCKRKWQQRLY